MSEIISIENFPASNVGEETFMTADAESGQPTISVDNVDSFSADDIVLVGIKGSETGQIMRVQSINNLSITFTANLRNKHFRGEAVYKLRADKAKVYRAANVDGSAPPDLSFAVISTIALEGDQKYTTYIDPAGGSSYWYKYTFFNSISGVESSLAEGDAVRGGNYGMYCTVDDVRDEAGLNSNRWVTDQTIYTRLVDAMSEVNSALASAGYTLPLEVVPGLIINATRLLAAGYVLTKEYGSEHSGLSKDGNQKIQQAYAILNGLKTDDKTLLDTEGNQVSKRARVSSGFPSDNDEDSPAMFSLKDQY